MSDEVILTENKLASLFAAAALGIAGSPSDIYAAEKGHKQKSSSPIVYQTPKAKKDAYITEQILAAIAKKETAGQKNVKKLDVNGCWFYGDYQIQHSYLDDANKEMGTRYTVKDVQYNNAIAKKVVKAYTTKWSRHFENTFGKKPSLRQVIAMHQGGGPRGWKSKHSLGYADSVLKLVKL
jgi:hypothetical protein